MKQRVPWRAIGKAARYEIREREWRRVELKIISVSSKLFMNIIRCVYDMYSPR